MRDMFVERNLAGEEDMYLSLESSKQIRNNKSVDVTGLSASSIPVTETLSLLEAWEDVSDFKTYLTSFGSDVLNLDTNSAQILSIDADFTANNITTVDILTPNTLLFNGNTQAQFLAAAEAQTITATDIKYDDGSGEIRRDNDDVIVINVGELSGESLAQLKSSVTANTLTALDIQYDHPSVEIRRADGTEVPVNADTLTGLTIAQLQNSGSALKYTHLVETSNSFPEFFMVAGASDGSLVHWGEESAGITGGGEVAVTDSKNTSLVPSPPGETGTIVKIVACIENWFVLYSSGNLYGIGDNQYGQIGTGATSSSVNDLTFILGNIADVICTSTTTINPNASVFAIDNNNDLWAWGENSFGELGLNTTVDTLTPTTVTIAGLNVDETVAKVYSQGVGSSYVLTNQGRVFSTGRNLNGDLGLGDEIARDEFEVVDSGGLDTKTVTKLVVCAGSVIALTSDNLLFFWGYGGEGQGAAGNTANSNIPVQITATPNTGNWTNVYASKRGGGSFYAVSSSNELWAWGRNDDGQLGLGDTSNKLSPEEVVLLNDDSTQNLSGIKQIESTSSYSASPSSCTLIITNDNKVFTAGTNNNGQCGNNSITDVDTFVNIRIPKPEDIIQVSSAQEGWYVLQSTGRIFSWGENNNRQVSGVKVSQNLVVPQLRNYR